MLPHLLSLSQQEILVLLVINVLLVSSYRLLTLTGEWSLAHVVIMGVGAYASALISKELAVPVPLSMLAGRDDRRLHRLSAELPVVPHEGLLLLDRFVRRGRDHSADLEVDRPDLAVRRTEGHQAHSAVPQHRASSLNVDFYDPVNYYYLCLIVVAIWLVILYRVERSRIGLTFHAIHWQDKLAESVGIDTFRYRMLAFVIASFFAGLAGALYAHYIGAVAPNRFDVEEMVYVVIWAIVGGTATFYGPIIGVVTLTILNEVVLRALGVDQMRPMFYGALLILFILFLPNGLEGLVPKIKEWIAGRKHKPAVAKQPAEAEQPAE